MVNLHLMYQLMVIINHKTKILICWFFFMNLKKKKSQCKVGINFGTFAHWLFFSQTMKTTTSVDTNKTDLIFVNFF